MISEYYEVGCISICWKIAYFHKMDFMLVKNLYFLLVINNFS